MNSSSTKSKDSSPLAVVNLEQESSSKLKLRAVLQIEKLQMNTPTKSKSGSKTGPKASPLPISMPKLQRQISATVCSKDVAKNPPSTVIDLDSDEDNEPLAKRIKIDSEKLKRILKEPPKKKEKANPSTTSSSSKDLSHFFKTSGNKAKHAQVNQVSKSVKALDRKSSDLIKAFGRMSAIKEKLAELKNHQKLDISAKNTNHVRTADDAVASSSKSIVRNIKPQNQTLKNNSAVMIQKYKNLLMKSSSSVVPLQQIKLGNQLKELSKNAKNLPIPTLNGGTGGVRVPKLFIPPNLFMAKNFMQRPSSSSTLNAAPKLLLPRPPQIHISPISRENVVKNNLARLESRWKACLGGNQNMKAYREMANIVISVLNRRELEQVSDYMLKKDILLRYDAFVERNKMKTMSANDRKVYLERKHSEDMEKRRQLLEISKRKFDDREIQTQLVLPEPTLVEMPADLTNSDFGDVLMVADFIVGYSELLSPVERFVVTAGSLTEALCNLRTSGYETIGKVLEIYLETLIQTESHTEMGLKLEDLTVNMYTASDLIRIMCNVKGDDDDTDSGFNTSSSSVETLGEQCLADLATKDFYCLSPKTLLDILVFLLNKVLQTPAFDEFLKNKEAEHTEAWKEKMDAQHELKKIQSAGNKTEKNQSIIGDNKNEIQTTSKETKSTETTNTNALSLSHFYGKVAAPSSSSTTVANESVEVPLHSDTEDKRKPVNKDSDHDENELSAVESLSDVDSMIYKVKNRRVETEKAKAEKARRQAVEKERRQKETELQNREHRVAAAVKKCQQLQDFFKTTYRREPLGLDRNYSRYWFLPKSAPGQLLVEQGFNPEEENDVAGASLCTRKWYFYNKEEQVENLLKNLLQKGIRESCLHNALTKLKDSIVKNMKRTTEEIIAEPESKNKTSAAYEPETVFKNFLKEEFVLTENKIRHGGLGAVREFDVWKTKLDTAETIDDLAQCLIDLKNGVRPTLLKGIMAAPRKSTGAKLDDDEVTAAPMEDAPCHYGGAPGSRWLTAVRHCATWSRLAVLYYGLHSCIMWEKSVEHAPCKICRKRKDDDLTILCDECNDCYHMYCLRPPLRQVPEGDWFCIKCKRPEKRKKETLQYYESEEEDDENEPTSSTKHDDSCRACHTTDTMEDRLVLCSSCPAAFHMECHVPPLRHAPRSGWRCCCCVKGISFGRNLRKRRT